MGKDSEMSKPVAYGMLTFCKNCGEQNPYAVKELTDEEIDEVAQALIDDCSYCSLHFARAILKKAQEK
jgi:hypothetical protein